MEAAQEGDRFPGRGSTVLYVIAITLLVGVVLGLAAPGPEAVRSLVVTMFGLNVAYLVGVANGLARGMAWARPVAILVLWLVAISGLIDMVIALGQNRINIPIGTILAAFALASPAGPIVFPEGPDRQRAQLAALAGLLLFLLPFLFQTSVG